jgi:5-methyltetrahydrofolate--homocysteine methyltransferase
MSFDRIRHRLTQGRPLVVDADTGASFRARGVSLDVAGALGLLLRERPLEVLDHYRAEVRSRVDVLSALTVDTTPRALAEVGMQHRAAMLTGLAVELAFEAAQAADKPVAVAGVLSSDMLSPVVADRLHGELCEHAERLAVAGVELLIARGLGSRLGLMAAVVAAAGTDLPVWAVVECLPNGDLISGGTMPQLLDSLEEAGASAVLFEVPSVDCGIEQLRRALVVLEPGSSIAAGVLLASSDHSVRGFYDDDSQPRRWVTRALDLSACGARIIGGGAGTTEGHTEALAIALGALHPSLPAGRIDSELGGRPGSP